MSPAHSSNRTTQCSRWSSVSRRAGCALATALICLAGCRCCDRPAAAVAPDHARLAGSTVDALFSQQETNAEAAKFVIYQHEFELNKPEWEQRLDEPYTGQRRGFRLSPRGIDHVRQIARQLQKGVQFPVVVERNSTTISPDTEYQYAVHYGDELDEERRALVVRTLQHLGVVDAAARVIIAPAFSTGLNADEAAQAWEAGFGSGQAGGSNSLGSSRGGLF